MLFLDHLKLHNFREIFIFVSRKELECWLKSGECIGDLGNSHKQLKSTFRTSCVHDYVLKQQFSDAPCDPQTFKNFQHLFDLRGQNI